MDSMLHEKRLLEERLRVFESEAASQRQGEMDLKQHLLVVESQLVQAKEDRKSYSIRLIETTQTLISLKHESFQKEEAWKEKLTKREVSWERRAKDMEEEKKVMQTVTEKREEELQKKEEELQCLNNNLEKEKENLQFQNNSLEKEKEELQFQNNSLEKEKDELQYLNDKLKEEIKDVEELHLEKEQRRRRHFWSQKKETKVETTKNKVLPAHNNKAEQRNEQEDRKSQKQKQKEENEGKKKEKVEKKKKGFWSWKLRRAKFYSNTEVEEAACGSVEAGQQ